MKLELVNEVNPETWDNEISHFDTKFLFHQSAWLKFLEESQPGKTLRFKIINNRNVIGYFTCLLLKKGPIKILGSPLPGWTTNYMGPIVNKSFDFENFLYVLDDLCRQMGIHHIELCNPCLDPNIALKMGFSISEKITYLVPLSSHKDQMWKNLKSNCRNRIRKGIKNGLTIN